MGQGQHEKRESSHIGAQAGRRRMKRSIPSYQPWESQSLLLLKISVRTQQSAATFLLTPHSWEATRPLKYHHKLGPQEQPCDCWKRMHIAIWFDTWKVCTHTHMTWRPRFSSPALKRTQMLSTKSFQTLFRQLEGWTVTLSRPEDGIGW